MMFAIYSNCTLKFFCSQNAWIPSSFLLLIRYRYLQYNILLLLSALSFYQFNPIVLEKFQWAPRIYRRPRENGMSVSGILLFEHIAADCLRLFFFCSSKQSTTWKRFIKIQLQGICFVIPLTIRPAYLYAPTKRKRHTPASLTCIRHNVWLVDRIILKNQHKSPGPNGQARVWLPKIESNQTYPVLVQ